MYYVRVCSCKGLLLLETFTANTGDDLELPQFLKIVREVTGDPCYSMYNLSLMEEYKNVKPNDADNSVVSLFTYLFICCKGGNRSRVGFFKLIG